MCELWLFYNIFLVVSLSIMIICKIDRTVLSKNERRLMNWDSSTRSITTVSRRRLDSTTRSTCTKLTGCKNNITSESLKDLMRLGTTWYQLESCSSCLTLYDCKTC